MALDQVPEWLGAAVVGAVLAALGYLAKAAIDAVTALREAQRARRARLIALRSLLRAARVTFQVQQAKAVELIDRIAARTGNGALRGTPYERALSESYPVMTAEERELHGIVRGYSLVTQHELNDAMLKWLDGESYFTGQTFADARFERLARLLADLHAHLLLWRAKFQVWIPDRPEHALVYMADEGAHGLGFPTEIDAAVEEVLQLRPGLFG
jgi:hypothetical protein